MHQKFYDLTSTKDLERQFSTKDLKEPNRLIRICFGHDEKFDVGRLPVSVWSRGGGLATLIVLSLFWSASCTYRTYLDRGVIRVSFFWSCSSHGIDFIQTYIGISRDSEILSAKFS